MNDYISRQDATRAARHGWYKGLELSQYIEIIDAADVAPVRHGEWQKISCSKPGRDAWWCCTLCGRNIRASRPQDYLYCPKCGAKMDGGTHDEPDA